MTISNGSTILAADLSSMIDASLALMRTDNASDPIAFPMAYRWTGLLAGTAEYARQLRFVSPASMHLEAIALSVTGMDGTTTALLEAGTDDAATLAFIPAEVSVIGGGAGVTSHATRTLYDNSKALAVSSYMSTNPVFRTLSRGTPMRLTITTTNAIVASTAVNVVLALRERWVRP